MTTITKEQALAVFDLKAGYTLGHADVSIMKELARIALASLEAEPVAYLNRFTGRSFELEQQPGADKDPGVYIPLYAAPPAPVVPPEQSWEELCRQNPDMSIGDAIIRAAWWNLCRAAMLKATGE